MEDQEKVMDELVRGREFANQLRQVISGDDNSPFAQHLVKNVLSSFTNALLLLEKFSINLNQMQQGDSSSAKSDEDSQESCKMDRGGNHKRCKTTERWEKVSEVPEGDDYQWRKYGQKEIQNSKYSRNYYRCTYKFDQKCEATKQVQRIQDEPPLYKTTYYGHHTCKKLPINTEITIDLSSPPETSILLSFDNTFSTPAKQGCPFLSSSPEPTIDKSSRHLTMSSTLESNHRDVMSNVILHHSVELDDDFFPDFI